MSNSRSDQNDGVQLESAAPDHNEPQPKLEQQASVQSNSGDMIKDVWLANFFPTMEKISSLIDDFNYISMDTEYPGTVYVPPNTQNEFEYQMIRGNCDNLKLIQVGITLSNDKGETPRGSTCAWQFNLQFDHEVEQSINESMQLLRESGFEFEKHKTEGIPHKLFAEYLISSGLVLNQRNHWITFHGSGDFGYLLRILLGHNLPNLQDDFLNLLDSYFQNYYDCKEIKREIDVSGGLVKLAKELDVDRIGTMHQAGSDAYVTCKVFFRLRIKLKQLWCVESETKIEERFNGKIYGIGDSYNDDNYIESYKHCAKKSQYIDNTGYVNLRLLQQGYSTTNNTQATTNQNHHTPNTNSGSAHGFIQPGLNMGINQDGNGRRSAGGFMQQNSNTPNHYMPQNFPNGHGINNIASANMSNLNSSGHGQSHTPDMSSQFNQQFMMPNSTIGMNNIDNNLLNQMNLNLGGSFTPQTLNMNGMNQNQHQHNQQNINAIQQMNFLGSQQSLINNSALSGSMEEDPMGGQPNSQYNRMMNTMQKYNSTGANQNHLNINSFQHMMNNNQSQNQVHQTAPQAQFGYPAQYHQQLLDASGTHTNANQNQYVGRAGGQPHPTSSPNLMAQGAPAANTFNNHMMNQHHQMNNHQMHNVNQMQQQQQNNNYYGGQSYN